MMSKDAKRIQGSLTHLKMISGLACKALRVFLVAYLLLTVPVFCFGLVMIATSGLSPQDTLWMGFHVTPMALSIVVAVSVCLTIINLFRDVGSGNSPFSDSQSKRFKVIGWLLLASFVLAVFTSIAPLPHAEIGSLTFGILDLGNSSSGINFDLSYLLWAIVSFSFSQVFKYGALLQQLSDETV